MDKLLQRYPQSDHTDIRPDDELKRAMQAVAFHNARAARRPPDRFAHTLLDEIGPHLARVLPSCAVAQVDNPVQRGTELAAALPSCRFRTVYDVAPGTVRIAAARYVQGADIPPALGLPAAAAAVIEIAFESTGSAVSLDEMAASPVRLYIDTDSATRAALMDALFIQALGVCVHAHGQWFQLAASPFAPVGWSDGEALVPARAREEHGPRLLREYFAFPEKFGFIDIDLTPALARCAAGTRRLVLHVVLPAPASADSLGKLSATALKPDCTPVVNLFTRDRELAHMGRYGYPLQSDVQLFSVDAVTHRAADGTASPVAPFDTLRRTQGGRYWLARHVDTVAGAESAIALVDADQAPVALADGCLAVRLSCTNGDLAATLPADAALAAGDVVRGRLLFRPTLPQVPAHPWDLIAALAPKARRLTQDGLPALQDLLRLHGAPLPLICGIGGLDHGVARAWLRFPQGAAYLQGVEVRLTVDEAAFAEHSLFMFAQVMDRFFSYYAQARGFTQLVVLTTAGDERVRCAARAGPALPA